MKIPLAQIGYKDNGEHETSEYSVMLWLEDISTSREFPVNYTLGEVSHINPWYANNSFIISSGNIERSFDDDFDQLKNLNQWYDFGSIDNWRVTMVSVYFRLQGNNNYMTVSLDEIIIDCQ